jgi:hypothetical protein
MNEPWIVLGTTTTDAGEEVEVGLPLRDLRVHATVLGTTGSGKSTFLRNLAIQAFGLGATVVVIEPHGDLVLHPKEGIIAGLPPQLLGQVVVVDLNSPWPPQINLCAAGLSAGRAVAVDTAMRCIQVAEEASWGAAVRMREMLEHGLHLLLSVLGRGASMVHLNRFLADAPFRQEILAKAGDDVAESRDFWKRMSEKQETRKSTSDEMDVPLRRVGKFLRDDRFRRSLALPGLGNELKIAPLLDSALPRMILVPLQAAVLGEEAKRVFGTLFMQMCVHAFLARTVADERRQTLIIIDEFADLAGGAIGELVKILLAQARKFGASVVLATQSIYQLPPDVKLEVRSNTNIKIILRIAGRDDAKEAALNLGDDRLSESDLMNIERFHGYAKVMVHGSPQPPFYFASLPPVFLGDNAAVPPLSSGENLPDPSELQAIQAIHRMARENPEQAITRLAQMPDREFAAMVGAQITFGQQRARMLLDDPGLEPDQVRRALKISRSQYGLPWWFYEAAYRRIR